MRTSIPASEAATMRKLLSELPGLVWDLRNAAKVDEAAQALTGSDLERFRMLEARLIKTVILIREIAEN